MGELLFMRGKRKDIPPVGNLRAIAYQSGKICVSFEEPTGDYDGVRLVCKAGSYPASITDGTYYDIDAGDGDTIQVAVNDYRYGKAFTSLTNGTAYYIAAYSYYIVGDDPTYSDPITIVCTAQAFDGSKVTITESGIWTVPEGWWGISFAVVGAGGAGGDSAVTTAESSGTRGAGGGGSGYMVTDTMSVVPGQQIPVVIGKGTTGAGGESVFNTTHAGGGMKGGNGCDFNTWDGNGGAGGTGGSGGGVWFGSYDGDPTYGGGDSAANGANGNGSKGTAYSQFTSGGSGDGNIKLFDNVYYCYGGAGGAAMYGISDRASAAGSGPSYWGGSGGGYKGPGQDGAPNSGNGGGGGGSRFYGASQPGGKGGDGVVVIVKTA